jgi:hypothetical protein
MEGKPSSGTARRAAMDPTDPGSPLVRVAVTRSAPRANIKRLPESSREFHHYHLEHFTLALIKLRAFATHVFLLPVFISIIVTAAATTTITTTLILAPRCLFLHLSPVYAVSGAGVGLVSLEPMCLWTFALRFYHTGVGLGGILSQHHSKR